jgi:sporulation protein YlmC with PRC-barrel domain
MKRAILATSAAACLCLGLAAPLLAAETATPDAGNPPSSGAKNVSAAKPAEKCLSDLRAFDTRMEKDGHWIGGSGYGYGYPMGEIGYGYSYPMGGASAATAAGYVDARPGYEVRTLVAAANILARHGQQEACENVLATTRQIYKLYAADMKSGDMPIADLPGWRNQVLATAVPVTDKDMAIRSDELLGSPVRNLQDIALGSVDDLVMDPKTGKIAYLVIGRGGVFGIDEKYVPVPWDDFKITQNVNLLVLDTSKTALDAAPKVSDDQFAQPGQFGHESQNVDSYWKAHLSSETAVAPKG